MAGDNNVAGSIRKLTLDGVTYDVMHDANFNITGSEYENTAIATSGDPIRKMQKRVQAVESVVIKTNGAEFETISAGADSAADISMAFVTAAGDTYRSSGFYEVVKRETEENRTELKLFPRKKWKSFLA